MPEVGAYEAKTHLSELLERVRKGERIVITKHGHPVAELTPIGMYRPDQVRITIEKMRVMREKLARRGVRLHDLLEENESLRSLAHRGHRR